MRKMWNKIIYPNKWIRTVSIVIGFFLLFFVFYFQLEKTFLAYLVYLWSTYDLIIFLVWFIDVCKCSSNYIRKNSKLYQFYCHYAQLFQKITLYFSMFLNFFYGLFKFGMGMYFKSFWFITFAVYYFVLWEMKLSLVKNMKNDSFEKNIMSKYKMLRKTGLVLLLLNFILLGIIVLIFYQNQTISYSGNLIYIIAMYDFYLIISASISIFRHRNVQNPVVLASKCINFTVAMIAMISLEVAMIYEFGNNDIIYRNVMISITTFVVVIVNSLIAVALMVKSNQFLKNK